MSALDFDDLCSALKGERNALPALCYSLPLSASQAEALRPLLVDNTSVEKLRLRRCRLDDGAAEHLAFALGGNGTLRSLDLRDNEITDAGARGQALPA